MGLIKSIVKIIRYATIKFGINGFLFFFIIIQGIIVSFYCDDLEFEYEFYDDFEVVSAQIYKAENQEEYEKYIDDYYLDDYNSVYEIKIEVLNRGSQDVDIGYELTSMTFKGDNKESYHSVFVDYYSDFEDYSDPDTWVIPSGTTIEITYYIIMDKFYVPDKIHIYDTFGDTKYCEIDMP